MTKISTKTFSIVTQRKVTPGEPETSLAFGFGHTLTSGLAQITDTLGQTPFPKTCRVEFLTPWTQNSSITWLSSARKGKFNWVKEFDLTVEYPGYRPFGGRAEDWVGVVSNCTVGLFIVDEFWSSFLSKMWQPIKDNLAFQNSPVVQFEMAIPAKSYRATCNWPFCHSWKREESCAGLNFVAGDAPVSYWPIFSFAKNSTRRTLHNLTQLNLFISTVANAW